MRSAPLLAALALFTVAAVAQADAEPAPNTQVARLLGAKSTLRWNYSQAGVPGRYGHAEALVDAPADKVIDTAKDFSHYRDLHKKFSSARVIAKDAATTDVLMRYPVQIGAIHIEFSEVMRFGQPRVDGAAHVLEARAVSGDLKDGRTVITVKPVDAKHSLLEVDVLLVPKVPAPQSLVDEELRDGAADFVNGLKDRAQGWVGPVTSL